jgi:hypothetical protein
VVINKKNFIDYLLFLREEYRIQRGLWPDEWDKLLHYTYAIDEICNRIDWLEKELEEQQRIAKEKYAEKLKEEAQKNNI